MNGRKRKNSKEASDTLYLGIYIILRFYTPSRDWTYQPTDGSVHLPAEVKDHPTSLGVTWVSKSNSLAVVDFLNFVYKPLLFKKG